MTRARHNAPAYGVPVIVDDLTRARAKRIAAQQSTEQIRAALREAKALCPACQQPLRTHTNTQLTLCALALDDESPRGA